MRIVVILFLMMALVGCVSEEEQQKPAIEYFETDCSMDSGADEIYIRIDSSGDGYYKQPFKLDDRELPGLLEDIEEAGFYDLDRSYDEGGYDFGTCKSIHITRGNSTKEVFVHNITASFEIPSAFTDSEGLIKSIAEEKIR